MAGCGVTAVPPVVAEAVVKVITRKLRPVMLVRAVPLPWISTVNSVTVLDGRAAAVAQVNTEDSVLAAPFVVVLPAVARERPYTKGMLFVFLF